MRNSKNCSNKNTQTKVNINTPFVIIMKLFRYIGLSTFTDMAFTNRCQKIWHLKWCFFNFVIFSITYFLIFYYNRELFYIGDNFGQLGDFVKVATVGIAHFITLLETLWAKQSSAEFFRIYSALHQQWAEPEQTKQEFQIYKRFFVLMFFYITVVLTVEINYIFEIHHKRQWISFFIAYMPSVIICRIRMMQISMHLFMIMKEILQLNKEILEVANTTKSLQLNFMEDLIYKDLSVLMRKYQAIHFMMELFKKSFSMSFLMIFINSYIKILSDSYWAYWVIYNKDDVYEFAEYSLVIPTALIVCLTLIISKDCMSAAKLIPQSLHCVRHRVENLQLSYKIQNFSLQLRHQQIVFDASGCFVVDCYIVSGVLHSITMYIIFYIEFMPKFKNL